MEEPWEVLTDLNREQLRYARFARALSEGVRVEDYARRMVLHHGDDVRPNARLTSSVPFAYVAV